MKVLHFILFLYLYSTSIYILSDGLAQYTFIANLTSINIQSTLFAINCTSQIIETDITPLWQISQSFIYNDPCQNTIVYPQNLSNETDLRFAYSMLLIGPSCDMSSNLGLDLIQGTVYLKITVICLAGIVLMLHYCDVYVTMTVMVKKWAKLVFVICYWLIVASIPVSVTISLGGFIYNVINVKLSQLTASPLLYTFLVELACVYCLVLSNEWQTLSIV